MEPGGVSRLFFESESWRRAQLGQASEDAAWTSLGARLNLAPEMLAQLRHGFWAGDQLDEGLVQFIRSLRPRLKVGLLSNFAASLRALLAQYRLADTFDAIVISGEEGVVKPEARIYQLAAERLGTPIGDCLFVDDFADNIAGARRAGMQALHFAPVEAAKMELERLVQRC